MEEASFKAQGTAGEEDQTGSRFGGLGFEAVRGRRRGRGGVQDVVRI